MKLAIIGTGVIAQNQHIPCFTKNGAKITAVYDRHIEKAERIAAQLGAEAYDDYERLLREADADAVSICTRTDMHASMAVAAANAGKNIFLEKPMAVSAAEAERIVAAVDENDVIFMLGMLNRFRTESLILTRRRKDGSMGDIYHCDCRWIRRRGVPANPWFSQKALSGGGPGIDIGVHAIDTAWYLMGCPKPTAVSAVAHSRLGKVYAKGIDSYGSVAPTSGPMDVEDALTALVRFEQGKSMTVTVSWAINGPDEDLNIKLYGTKEGASLNPFVIYGEDDGYLTDYQPRFMRGDAWTEGFMNETAHFISCAEAHRKTITNERNVYTVQKIIDGIYRSAESGGEIVL